MTTDLRWAVMGTGRIAGNVLPRIPAAQGCRVTGGASRSADRARAFAQETGLQPAAACTYEELLGRSDVDAVYVTLPNHLHATWSKRLLEAGKHVLCEKPLTAFRADAEEVFATARHAGRVGGAGGGGRLMVEGFMYMHHPQTARLVEIARAGEVDGSVIGRLERIVGRFDIDLVGVPHAWTRFLHSMWGGALLDLGCYPIGLARLVTGQEPISIERTSVKWAEIPDGESKPVDLACGAELVFDGGVRAICHCSMGAKDARHVTFRMEGTWGSVETGDPFKPDEKRAVLSVERNERHPDGAGRGEIAIEHGGERFENQFADFATAVRRGRGEGDLLPSPRWSIEQAEVLEWILRDVGLVFDRS